jgi:hypothetical protein
MEAWYPSTIEKDDPLGFGREFLGPVVGTQSTFVQGAPRANGPTLVSGHPIPVGLGGTSTWAHQTAEMVDLELSKLPAAYLDLTVTKSGDSVRARVVVDSVEVSQRPPLAIRIVLVEDTVRLRGGTVRRVHVNVVRGFASAETFPLGIPVDSAADTTATFAFDLATIQKNILAGRDSAWAAQAESRPTRAKPRWRRAKTPPDVMEYVNRFPDVRDWTMNRARLHVVAFVQNIETGEILQAVMVRVPETDGTAHQGG